MTDYNDMILAALGEMEVDGLDINSLDEKTSLLEQGFDSLDMMDLYFKLEEKTGKKIEFDQDTTQQSQWASIEDIAKGLSSL